VRIDGRVGMAQQQHRRGRDRRHAVAVARAIGESAVVGAERSDGGGQLRLVGHDAAKVLIRAGGEKRGVDGPDGRAGGLGVAAVTAPEGLEAGENRPRGQAGRIGRKPRPGAGEAGQVHEVQPVAVPEATKVRGDADSRHLGLQGDEAFDAEDGVVEVALARAILETAVRVQPPGEERRDETGGLTELLRREPRHLQHFEPQTHCTIL
jgi:hypothetical protein